MVSNQLVTESQQYNLPGISNKTQVSLPPQTDLKNIFLPTTQYYDDFVYIEPKVSSTIPFSQPGVKSYFEKMEVSRGKAQEVLYTLSRMANAGRIIYISDGHLFISNNAEGIHHIQGRENWNNSWKEASKTFPLSEDLRFMLKEVTGKSYGRKGDFLANLIPLSDETHKDDIHDKKVLIINTICGEFHLDQILVAFTIFNVNERRKQLNEVLRNKRVKHEITENCFNWLMGELNSISKAALILISTHKELYDLWSKYVEDNNSKIRTKKSL